MNHYYMFAILLGACAVILQVGKILYQWKADKMGWSEYAAKCSKAQFLAMIEKLEGDPNEL